MQRSWTTPPLLETFASHLLKTLPWSQVFDSLRTPPDHIFPSCQLNDRSDTNIISNHLMLYDIHRHLSANQHYTVFSHLKHKKIHTISLNLFADTYFAKLTQQSRYINHRPLCDALPCRPSLGLTNKSRITGEGSAAVA